MSEELLKRLEAIEKHMAIGDENRKILMTGFVDLKKSVDGVEEVLFGQRGEGGMVHQVNALIKIADGIRWVLNKILIAICTAISLAVLPYALGWLSHILKH